MKHKERTHALLSASGASRWLNCTPSARLEEEYGEDKSSVYAEEGTLAHELAELEIRKDIYKEYSAKEYKSKLEQFMANELFSPEMLEVVPIYTNYCRDQYMAASTNSPYAVIEIEQRLDLTDYIPESFGTADCVIISDGVMEVIDLKYGKGVAVDAADNKQLMLYGLGALRKYDTMYDIHSVTLTIVQPRLDNISSWTISVEDLLFWAENELKNKAQLAFNGQGELKSGSWCKFCGIKNRCRKLYENQLEIARHEFAEAAILSDEEIADILDRAPQFIEWVNSITEYAKSKAVDEGKVWPGFKLVEGVSRRKWVDEGKVADKILQHSELDKDDIYTVKLNGITEIEKLLGKKRFSELLADLVVKPQGKPTLVKESDKRPAIGYGQAVLDFK